jgi:hypothetical protein
MLRTFRPLALVVAAALTSIAAAPAVAAEFHSEGSPTTFTASQVGTDVVNFNSGTFECEEITYKGTISASTAATVALIPAYNGCSALSGFSSSTIAVNGCEYRLNQPTGGTGTYSLVCPAGKEIIITTSIFGTTKCTIHIPPQGPISTLTYDNKGAGATRELAITASASQIEYNETAGSGFGACAGGEDDNGTWAGTTAVTGEHGSPATHTGIWVA